jgi:hypothetical protein
MDAVAGLAGYVVPRVGALVPVHLLAIHVAGTADRGLGGRLQVFEVPDRVELRVLLIPPSLDVERARPVTALALHRGTGRVRVHARCGAGWARTCRRSCRGTRCTGSFPRTRPWRRGIHGSAPQSVPAASLGWEWTGRPSRAGRPRRWRGVLDEACRAGPISAGYRSVRGSRPDLLPRSSFRPDRKGLTATC